MGRLDEAGDAYERSKRVRGGLQDDGLWAAQERARADANFAGLHRCRGAAGLADAKKAFEEALLCLPKDDSALIAECAWDLARLRLGLAELLIDQGQRDNAVVGLLEAAEQGYERLLWRDESVRTNALGRARCRATLAWLRGRRDELRALARELEGKDLRQPGDPQWHYLRALVYAAEAEAGPSREAVELARHHLLSAVDAGFTEAERLAQDRRLEAVRRADKDGFDLIVARCLSRRADEARGAVR
jgi:hypothetical protein